MNSDRFVPVTTNTGELIHGELDSAEDYQDMKDGAALRRLREALPEDTEISQQYQPWRPEPYRYQVQIYPSTQLGPYAGDPAWFGSGATIAEAADKCREALR